MFRFTRMLVVLLAALAFLAVPGRAAKPPEGGATPKAAKEKEIPLHITSAKLEADQQQRLITFSGQVKAVYGDSTLYCDQLLVYYQPTTPPQEGEKGAKPEAKPGAKPADKQEPNPLGDLGGEKIDRIVAKGKVRFVQDDKVATGEEAVYYKDRELIELKGNPQVWRGDNNLKGDKIILYLKTKRVMVESSAQRRVEAHLYQAEGKSAGMKELFPDAGPKSPKKPKR